MKNLIGKKCIVRSHLGGVFCGTVVDGDPASRWVELVDAEQYWSWTIAGAGFASFCLAFFGVNRAVSKVSQIAARSVLTDVIQVVVCRDQ